MSRFVTLVGKLLLESRWTLALNALAMFWLGWLNTHFTSRAMSRIREAIASGGGRGARMVRDIGGADAVVSVATLEVAFWLFPFLWLPMVLWSVNRGSVAVAGEVERGTLDLILSRPISRFSYLLAHVVLAAVGVVVVAGALVVGNRVSTTFNPVDEAPTALVLAWPALNLAALGFAIFGMTLAASAADRVRWRATTLGSVVTLGGYICWITAHRPEMSESPLLPVFRSLALFETYNPVDAVTSGELFLQNLAILGGLGLGGLIVAFTAFLFRDLPANG